MTLSKFFLISFIQLAVFTGVKIYFFQSPSFGSGGLTVAYWAATGILAAALVRRMGVMNYLEGMFTGFFWFGLDILADLIFTSEFTGLKIYSTKDLWFGYLIMAVAAFAFHKKRHVAIRRGKYHDPSHH